METQQSGDSNKESKVFLLDTNIIGETGAQSFFEVGSDPDDFIILPTTSLEEFDKLKKKESIGVEVREASRIVQNAARHLIHDKEISDLLQGDPNIISVGRLEIKNGNGKTYQGSKVIFYNVPQEITSKSFLPNLGDGDNSFIKIAKYFQDKHKNLDFTFLTNDNNLTTVALVNGIQAETRKKTRVDMSNMVKGYDFLSLDKKRVEKFYSKIMGTINNGVIMYPIEKNDKYFVEHLNPNEYLVFATDDQIKKLTDKNHPTLEGFTQNTALRYDVDLNALVSMEYNGHQILNQKPTNFEQSIGLDLMTIDILKGLIITGKAGTGKTFLALLKTVEDTLNKRKEENKDACIYLTKPTYTVDREENGIFPGGLTPKAIMNYLGMMKNYDKIIKKAGKGSSLTSFRETIQEGDLTNEKFSYEEYSNSIIRIFPLAYFRGVTLSPDETLILDESQNAPPKTMKTIFTRVGEGRIFVLGDPDPAQMDNPFIRPEYTGLIHALNSIRGLKNNEDREIFGHINFNYCKRSRLARIAADHF